MDCSIHLEHSQAQLPRGTRRMDTWHGGGMAALYTRAADRVQLAKGAIRKLERTPDEHFYPRTYPGGAGAES